MDKVQKPSSNDRLNVFDSRVLSGIHRPERDGVSGDWKEVHNNDVITCTLRQVLLELISREG
jgi:hypothetical protein